MPSAFSARAISLLLGLALMTFGFSVVLADDDTTVAPPPPCPEGQVCNAQSVAAILE